MKRLLSIVGIFTVFAIVSLFVLGSDSLFANSSNAFNSPNTANAASNASGNIEAKTYINKKSIYDFQSLLLMIKLSGSYESVSSAGYIDQTLLNDFEIKNLSVSTSSQAFEGEDDLYSRVMVYEIKPIRTGKTMIPAISILYDRGDRDGYISTNAIEVRVHGKLALVLHIALVLIFILIIFAIIFMIVVGIRNSRKLEQNVRDI